MNAVTLPIALLLFLPAPSSYVTAKADAMPKGGGCVAPVALVSTALGDTVRACPGDTILLDGSGSTAAAGHWVHLLGVELRKRHDGYHLNTRGSLSGW